MLSVSQMSYSTELGRFRHPNGNFALPSPWSLSSPPGDHSAPTYFWIPSAALVPPFPLIPLPEDPHYLHSPSTSLLSTNSPPNSSPSVSSTSSPAPGSWPAGPSPFCLPAQPPQLQPAQFLQGLIPFSQGNPIFPQRLSLPPTPPTPRPLQTPAQEPLTELHKLAEQQAKIANQEAAQEKLTTPPKRHLRKARSSPEDKFSPERRKDSGDRVTKKKPSQHKKDKVHLTAGSFAVRDKDNEPKIKSNKHLLEILAKYPNVTDEVFPTSEQVFKTTVVVYEKHYVAFTDKNTQVNKPKITDGSKRPITQHNEKLKSSGFFEKRLGKKEKGGETYFVKLVETRPTSV